MTRELFWLTLTVILTGLLWVPYIINRCQVRGLTGAMANPSRNDKPHADWANRLMFAHDNAIENLIIFAPLVLILKQPDLGTALVFIPVLFAMLFVNRPVDECSEAISNPVSTE